MNEHLEICFAFKVLWLLLWLGVRLKFAWPDPVFSSALRAVGTRGQGVFAPTNFSRSINSITTGRRGQIIKKKHHYLPLWIFRPSAGSASHTRNQLRKTESRTQNLSLGGYFYCHIVGWILFEVAWEFLYFWRFHDILNFNYYCTTSAHCLKINPNFKALFLIGGILKIGLILTHKYMRKLDFYCWFLLYSVFRAL